ncbi:hypothetical protein [Sphingobacterium bambusae]|uniref:KTSC domain-containing protein n=1 Tax=Sphingobacterium bambusae TaxID=662858 RepID=A0ABW6BAD2_9SPHI|nr:hypothetical protein [Sphingobacterium bambusae]WPL48495.1 hypothetical protein SCB77_21330 [Sphingobacterium bambusae]
MTPAERHLKIIQNGRELNFIYYPGRSENTFDVINLDLKDTVYSFSFDLDKKKYSTAKGLLDQHLLYFIGKHILHAEF